MEEEGRLVFKCISVENYEYAKTHGIWQQPSKVAKDVEIGDIFYIQLMGTDRMIICKATSNMYEDVPYLWPKQIEEAIYTVRFIQVNTGYRGSHQYV